MSPGRSNRIFRGRPGDIGGGRPGDQYLPAEHALLREILLKFDWRVRGKVPFSIFSIN